MMPVESHRPLIFGIDQKREDGRRCLQAPGRRIGQQGTANTSSLKAPVDSQAADPDSGQGRIARQTPGYFKRKFGYRNAGRSQRVISRELAALILDRDKTIGDAAADVLSDLGPKVTIENVFAAIERRAVAIPR